LQRKTAQALIGLRLALFPQPDAAPTTVPDLGAAPAAGATL
jgi:hypothetical protein